MGSLRAAALWLALAVPAAAGQAALTPEDHARAVLALWDAADAVAEGRIRAVRALDAVPGLAIEIDTPRTLRGARRGRWTLLLRDLDGDAEAARARVAALIERHGSEAVFAIDEPGGGGALGACAPEADAVGCSEAVLALSLRAGTPLAPLAGEDGAPRPEIVSSPACLADLSIDGLGCSGGNAACAALETIVSKRVYCARGGLYRFLSEPFAREIARRFGDAP